MKKIYGITSLKFVKKFPLIAFCFIAITVLLFAPILATAGIIGAALFTPGPGFTEFRKKAGFGVYSKNHYGNFMRCLKKPINPRSEDQVRARANVTLFSQSFKSLTQEQILSWNAYGKAKQSRNVLGQQITLTGEAWYIKINSILATCGETPISDPPAMSAAAPSYMENLSAVLDINVAVGTFLVSFDNVIPADHHIMLFASPVKSGGVSYNSDYRLIKIDNDSFVTGTDIKADYDAKFGANYAEGDVIFIKAKIIESATGLESQETTFRCVVIDTTE